MNNEEYHVGQYTLDGKRVATISGMGRHKGTLDHTASRRTAQRWAKQLRAEDKTHNYKAEHIYS